MEPPPRARLRRSRARRTLEVLVALGASAALVALLELGSRLVRPVEELPSPLSGPNVSPLQGFDPLLFWSPRPGWADPAVEPHVRLNGLGLRGPEVEPRRPGELRVLSLGESSTFGKRMPYEETYSARLEPLLAARTGRDVRVINAGVPGYTVFQGYQYLVHRGFEFDVDRVLLYFGYNDFLPVSRLVRTLGGARTAGRTDRETFEMMQGAHWRVHRFLGEHSNLYRALASQRGSLEPEDLVRDLDQPRVPEADRREFLERTLEACRERGVDLVVIVPWYRSFEKHVPLLREFAARHDLSVVDLPRVLPPRLEREREAYFFDTVHPTPEGHGLIAEAIAEVLAPAPGEEAR